MNTQRIIDAISAHEERVIQSLDDPRRDGFYQCEGDGIKRLLEQGTFRLLNECKPICTRNTDGACGPYDIIWIVAIDIRRVPGLTDEEVEYARETLHKEWWCIRATLKFKEADVLRIHEQESGVAV